MRLRRPKLSFLVVLLTLLIALAIVPTMVLMSSFLGSFDAIETLSKESIRTLVKQQSEPELSARPEILWNPTKRSS